MKGIRLLNIIKIPLLICCLCLGNMALGQDSSKTLNPTQFMNIIRQFHPVVKQTEIAIKTANANLLLAKAAFDPILATELTQKTFDGTSYYNTQSPQLTIPTWFGIEVFAGLENISGDRLDPMLTTGKTNYVGVSVPLAKDLLLDKRRAYLKQARIMQTMAQSEQQATVNNLMIEAMEDYWHWVKCYQSFLITSNNVTINEIRYKLVIKAFQFGERPAIDTTEALTQLLSFQYQKNQRWLEFQNAGLALSAYLWKENSQPYLLPEYVIPEAGWDNEQLIKNYTVQFPDLLNTATGNHPELKVYDAKLRALQVEKRLKQQALLPKIDLKYHQLGKGYNVLSSGPVMPLFENNFKYGLNFEMPLRLSEGRGDYKKTRLKIEETTLLQSQKRLQVELKIRSYYNELLYLQNQITLQANNYANYQKMVQAEEIKIQNGESTLFLLNSRETKALEALEKLIELKTKFHKTVYALQWSAGSLQ